MMRDELKFALVVENTFNIVPEPEFRQMLVEVLVMVSEWVDRVGSGDDFDSVVDLTAILNKANQLFPKEQREYCSDGSEVCCTPSQPGCKRICGICRSFLQLCPVGRQQDIHLHHRSHLLCPSKCPQKRIYIESKPQ